MMSDVRKGAIGTAALVVLGITAAYVVDRVGPVYAELAYTGLVMFIASMIVAWWSRGTSPTLSRYAFAFALAGLVPIVVGFVPERLPTPKDPTPNARVTALYLTLRSSMFTGFLTLGGFLLSLKTFIVVKMKEGVFDNERHVNKVIQRDARAEVKAAIDARRREEETDDVIDEEEDVATFAAPATDAKKTPKIKFRYYLELDRLRALLFGAICIALGTSISQVTLGLIESVRSSTYCFTIAAFEVGVLVQVLVVINHNLHDWFDTLEVDARKRLRAAKKKLVAEKQT